jgi:hypothetical protein
MDIKGDQYMVNGQRLKVFEPDVMPIDCIDIYTMEDEPERQDVKHGNFAVNNFSLTFLIFIESFLCFYLELFTT